MVVVSDGTDSEAARAIPERTNDSKKSLPKSEVIAGFSHRDKLIGGRSALLLIEDAIKEFHDCRKAELLRMLGAGTLVDTEMQHRVARA